ncbi:hypothetical protein [Nocardia iowensis]|uniref:Uncharacterized protein n=1 Tax=Nocardia iowensis TaxID=204891 RepID=A0ABX8RFS5_NOCIO|nr:hypothetical protein [Nocardia iowensis]QXN88211.1 hypothetical protein KV110_21615 [Nocardia iowensis]
MSEVYVNGAFCPALAAEDAPGHSDPCRLESGRRAGAGSVTWTVGQTGAFRHYDRK